MGIEPATRLRKSPNVVFRRLSVDESAVLLRLDTAAYHGLNATGAAIWERITDGITLAELVAVAREAFEDPGADLEADVTGFVTDLIERGLLEALPEAAEGS